ncbi:Asp23/Gls24 family envelope stress response protein [Kribbella sp. NPDC005582]|uniref:Asp23/Gls24 family envelope stress response protein n=1 Tax=Kribbella sp. NPDC005582 TaxID=3156893 RepID=UPI0033B910DE
MTDSAIPTASPKPAAKRSVASVPAADAVVADGIGSAGGRTSIADVVVSKIAGIATREIPGVHALGGGAARAVGMLRERIPGSKTNLSQGVSVEVGETQAAVDIELVAEYGVAIGELAGAIRENVISAVERMTGLEVTEVNISVTDVHLDGDDDDADDADDTTTEPRVR